MKCRNSRGHRSVTAWGVVLLLTLLPGCTSAILDAAAAGGLNFVQQSVQVALTDFVWGDIELQAAVSLTDGGEADGGHGG